MDATHLCKLHSESTRFEIQVTEGNTDWGRQFFPPSLQANYETVRLKWVMTVSFHIRSHRCINFNLPNSLEFFSVTAGGTAVYILRIISMCRQILQATQRDRVVTIPTSYARGNGFETARKTSIRYSLI